MGTADAFTAIISFYLIFLYFLHRFLFLPLLFLASSSFYGSNIWLVVDIFLYLSSEEALSALYELTGFLGAP